MKLITKNPLALDLPDYYHPAGTVTDNTTNPNFNKLLYSLFEHKSISVLDLGCSGGGFINDCINDGHIGYGLEPDIEVNKVIKNNFLRNPYPQDSQRYEDGVIVGADIFCSGYRKK